MRGNPAIMNGNMPMALSSMARELGGRHFFQSLVGDQQDKQEGPKGQLGTRWSWDEVQRSSCHVGTEQMLMPRVRGGGRRREGRGSKGNAWLVCTSVSHSLALNGCFLKWSLPSLFSFNLIVTSSPHNQRNTKNEKAILCFNSFYFTFNFKCSCQLSWKVSYSFQTQAQGKNVFIFICKRKKVTTHPILVCVEFLKYTGSQKETEVLPQDAVPKGDRL